MMKIQDPGRGLVRCFVRCLGLAAAAMLVLSAVASQRAEALSLINPGAVPTAKYASGGLTTEVHGGLAATASMVATPSMVQSFMAAGFEPVMSSTAAAFATAGSRSGTTAFTSTFTMHRPTIITRTVTAGSSGPIMGRGGSVTIATGATTTGAITTIDIIASTLIGETGNDG